MTCSHVILAALGYPADEWSSVSYEDVERKLSDDGMIRIHAPATRGFGRDGSEVYTGLVETFHPYWDWTGDQDENYDICVLVLKSGLKFNNEHVVSVQIGPEKVGGDDIRFIGYGRADQLPRERILSGSIPTTAPVNLRYQLSLPDAELAILPGCSGAPIFETGGKGKRRFLGMVSDAFSADDSSQGKTAYAIMPKHLAEHVPSNLRSKMGAAAITMPALFSQTFDRKEQTQKLKRRLDAKGTDGSLICLLAGIKDDDPLHCRDRLIKDCLETFLSRSEFSTKDLNSTYLVWSRAPEFDVSEAFEKVVLDADLANEQPASRPRVFHSLLNHRMLDSPSHLELLQKIFAFISQQSNKASRQGQAAPIVYFLILQLEDKARSEAVDDTDLFYEHYGDSQEHFKRLKSLVERSADVETHSTSMDLDDTLFLDLPLLTFFEPADIEAWIEECGDKIPRVYNGGQEIISDLKGEPSDARLGRWVPLSAWIQKRASAQH